MITFCQRSVAVRLARTATRKLVVILHGYGADGDNLIDLADYWQPILPEFSFMAPHGVDVHESGYGGYQWFSLQSMASTALLAGAQAASQLLRPFIEAQAQAHQLTLDDVILVGFSQGAGLALYLGLFELPVAGIMAYSGWISAPGQQIPIYKPPILLVHGTEDTVVPTIAFQQTQHYLQQHNCPVDSHLLTALGHSIDGRGVQLGEQFLRRFIPNNKP